MSDLDTRRRVVALRRAAGTSVPNPELEAANEEAQDWNGDCRYCGEHLVGTRTQLMAHRCEEYLRREAARD